MTEIKPVAYLFDWNLEKDDISVTHPTDLELISIIEPHNIRPLVLQAAYEALQKENAQWKTTLDCNERIRAAQAKRIAILEQSEAIEVIDLRKENERMKATLTQFSEVLKKHHEQSHYDLVNTLGEILVSAQKGTE